MTRDVETPRSDATTSCDHSAPTEEGGNYGQFSSCRCGSRCYQWRWGGTSSPSRWESWEENSAQLRFKVDNLVKTVEELQLENQRLRGELEAVKTPAEGVWRWQGGGDDLQSLSCPVVVRADRMREITGELEKLRNFVDKARTFGRPTP
jgi:hypothetical protein